MLHGLRIRRRLPVGPARWTLSDSRGLDSLTSDMLHGAHLAQIRIASRTPDDQHGAEPGRAESCRADPAGEVSVRPVRGPRELATALAEVRHFRADLSRGVGTLPQHRNLRAWNTVLHHRSAVLPKAGLKERQVRRSSHRCWFVVRAAGRLGVGVRPVSKWRQQAATHHHQRPEGCAPNRHKRLPWPGRPGVLRESQRNITRIVRSVVEVDPIRQAEVVARRVLGLHELSGRQLQKGLPAA